MFLKSQQLSWNVSISPSNLDSEGSALQRAILIQLLDDFATKKASKDSGYFIAVTTLDKIGQGIIPPHSGSILFPVNFTCITFKILAGEIMDGVVHRILKHGVFLMCGPAEKVYLSRLKMGEGYEYTPGEAPCFRKEGLEIRKGTKVRFSVLAEKFDETERDFQAVVGIEGDGLGPVS